MLWMYIDHDKNMIVQCFLNFFIYLCTYLFICFLFFYLFIYLFIYSFIYLFVYFFDGEYTGIFFLFLSRGAPTPTPPIKIPVYQNGGGGGGGARTVWREHVHTGRPHTRIDNSIFKKSDLICFSINKSWN